MKTTPAHLRVLRRVTETADGCWIYGGMLTHDGYGQISVGSHVDRNRSTARTHRVVYQALVGPIPEGLQLDHLCRVRACCNPAHLEPVTNRENILRGDTGPARNAAKTHCPKGHPLSGDNLATPRDPDVVHRMCRTCKVQCARDWRAKQRAAS